MGVGAKVTMRLRKVHLLKRSDYIQLLSAGSAYEDNQRARRRI